jgi:glycosyltransferase involved in cell wall biosynthesis
MEQENDDGAIEEETAPVLEGELLAPPADGPPDFAPAAGGPETVIPAYTDTVGNDHNPYRLLHAILDPPTWAEWLSIERLLSALSEAGVRQRVVMAPRAERRLSSSACDVDTLILPFRRFFKFRGGAALGRALHEFQPEIVLAWDPKSLSQIARRPESRDVYLTAKLAPGRLLKRLREADLLFGEGRSLVRRAVSEGWSGDRVRYLPSLVEATIAKPVPREKIGAPAGKDVLIAVGDLTVEGGFDVLIEAVAALDYCELWLVGSGKALTGLRRLAYRLGVAGRVRFLGECSDLAGLYAAADLAVVPAREDLVGSAIIEAWAQAKPIVATASEAASRLIAGGHTGHLVELENPAELARVIDATLHDPVGFDRLSREGRKAFEANYSETKVVTAWLSLFAWLTGRGTHDARPAPGADETSRKPMTDIDIRA